MASPTARAGGSKAGPSTEIAASMIRRMAGQSVNKAGIALDQTEINRKIVEASKNSKFYKDQEEKDRKLTVQIESLLAHRDTLLRDADVLKLERECDEMIAQIKRLRDFSQTIVHVDLDAFFANVEQLSDPTLKDIAFGVGAGVLTTASYEARKFGCRSGMPAFIARILCPHIRIVKAHFDEYNKWSRRVTTIFRRFDPNLSMAGCDEGYLNITAYMCQHKMTAAAVVKKLRAECVAETGLTVSAGIAPTKMLAKICSDINKPNGMYELQFSEEAVLAFTRPLKIRKIPGIGRVCERKLEALGVFTCDDIFQQRATLHLLNMGVRTLLCAALGCTSNVVQAATRADRKSIGVEQTFRRNKEKPEELRRVVDEIADELQEHIDSLQYTGRTLVLKYKSHDFKLHTKNRTIIGKEFRTKEEILRVAHQLLNSAMPLKVRLLGLRLTNLRDLNIPKTGTLSAFVSRKAPPLTRSAAAASSSSFFSFPKGKSRELDAETTLEVFDDEGGAMDDDGMGQFADEEETELDVDSDVEGDSVDGSSELWSASTTSLSPVRDKKATASPGKPSKRKTSPAAVDDSEPGVTCPLCMSIFPASTSNADINAHLDLCLNEEAISLLGSGGGGKSGVGTLSGPLSASSNGFGQKKKVKPNPFLITKK